MVPHDSQLYENSCLEFISNVLVSNSTMVSALRVQGSDLTPCEVEPISTSDKSCEPVPIAHAAGIPLYVRREAGQPRKSNMYIIVRMMSEPTVGVAPMRWQYGGMLGPAPTCVLARSDGNPFGRLDWAALDDFEMEMLDDGPRSVTRADWVRFVKKKIKDSKMTREMLDEEEKDYPEDERSTPPLDYSDAVVALEVLFPPGSQVIVNGLSSRAELNGCTATCVGQYKEGRVGVAVQGGGETMAVKRGNLTVVDA